jgi:hypothetical protein
MHLDLGSNKLNEILQKISIKQSFIIALVFVFCIVLSIKNTSESLYRLQETSFDRVTPFIERKALLLDNLEPFIPGQPLSHFRDSFRQKKYPESILFFLSRLSDHETLFNEAFDAHTGPLSASQHPKAHHIQHSLKSNDRQLAIALAHYHANAVLYNALHDKWLYRLFFRMMPYDTVPIVPSKRLTLDVLVVR